MRDRDRRWTRGRTVAYAAVAALIVIVGGGIAAAAMIRHAPAVNSAAHITTTSPAVTTPAGTSPSSVSAGPRSSHPGRSASPAAPAPALTPTVTPPPPTVTPPPTPPPTVTPPPTPSPTATRTRKPKPTPSRRPKKSPSPSRSVTPPGTLVASPPTVSLQQSPTGAPVSGTFTLTAQGGPVASFSITQPTGLSVSPSSGSLTAGQNITVTVTAGNPSVPPAATSVLTLSPGGATVTVTYQPAPAG